MIRCAVIIPRTRIIIESESEHESESRKRIGKQTETETKLETKMNRRDFLQALSVASVAGAAGGCGPIFNLANPEKAMTGPGSLYEAPPFGDFRILHTADLHAQALPIHYREPSVNLGFGKARGKPPHVVGEAALAQYGVAPGGAMAHAISHLGFEELAQTYGKMGGLAHLATLAEKLRGEFGREKTMHLDSGDMLQGSAVALFEGGRDMIAAANLAGVDALTGHWEFTYPEADLRAALSEFRGKFLAQNVFATEEAQFDGAEVYDEESGRVFPPHMIKEAGGRRIAVLGQAFPFTPISNPRRFIPDWTFGLRVDEMRALVEKIRREEKPDLVILLSHNGTDLDLRMAADAPGIDFVLGGHTHDAIPVPQKVRNAGGETWVLTAGCSGKFVGCLDVKFGRGRKEFQYRLLPVFSDWLGEAVEMARMIAEFRAPYAAELDAVLCEAGETLHRRGNFNGGLDQVLVDALRAHYDAEIALSPGFRWGTTIAAGAAIRMEDVMSATAMTYPETYAREMSGGELRAILEDVADNMFHPDPYYRQGGDMVRVGGMDYELRPEAARGGRIGAMRLDNGEMISAERKCKVAGWSTTGEVSPGPPVWDVAAEYLRGRGVLRLDKINFPILRGAKGNPGLADYPPELLG